jgi:hemin uptake protein HemP
MKQSRMRDAAAPLPDDAGTGCAVPEVAPIMPATPHAVSSRELMRGRRVLTIRHGEEEYRLQVTRSGKLILTK